MHCALLRICVRLARMLVSQRPSGRRGRALGMPRLLPCDPEPSATQRTKRITVNVTDPKARQYTTYRADETDLDSSDEEYRAHV